MNIDGPGAGMLAVSGDNAFAVFQVSGGVSATIGGITVENCGPLVETGADFLAVSAGVWAHPEGPHAAVAAFERMLNG